MNIICEANALSFLAYEAGGSATNGFICGQDIVPNSFTENTSFYVGSLQKINQLKTIFDQSLLVKQEKISEENASI